MKAWQIGAALGGGALGFAGLVKLMGRKRRQPSNWTVLGQPETDSAWTGPAEDPGTIRIVGPTKIPIPERYSRAGLAVAGVAPEMLRARVVYVPNAPVAYWLEANPKQAGTTTVSIVDSTGTLAHIALEQGVA